MGDEEGREEESKEKALDKLVERIINTPIENLPEMTDMPLNLIEPVAGMVMIDNLTEMLIKRCKENVDIAQARKKGRKLPEHTSLVLLSEAWRVALFRLRRSINADGLVRATDLAKEHMATRPYEEGKDAFELGKNQ